MAWTRWFLKTAQSTSRTFAHKGWVHLPANARASGSPSSQREGTHPSVTPSHLFCSGASLPGLFVGPGGPSSEEQNPHHEPSGFSGWRHLVSVLFFLLPPSPLPPSGSRAAQDSASSAICWVGEKVGGRAAGPAAPSPAEQRHVCAWGGDRGGHRSDDIIPGVTPGLAASPSGVLCFPGLRQSHTKNKALVSVIPVEEGGSESRSQ